jgi:hypothetical protein
MFKGKKAITDYFMQSKKLNKGEDSMKTCQIFFLLFFLPVPDATVAG